MLLGVPGVVGVVCVVGVVGCWLLVGSVDWSVSFWVLLVGCDRGWKSN